MGRKKGFKHSEETIAKIVKSRKGFKHSKETREKIGKGNKGKKLSEESIMKRYLTRKKNGWYKNPQEQSKRISLRNMGNTYSKGLKLTNEHKKKISNALKEYKKTPEHIKNIKKSRIRQVLPFKDSSIELKIQKFLSLLHLKFYTHKYISEIKNSYQCDVLIPIQKGINKKTIIECDGCFFHNCQICKFKLNKESPLGKRVREQHKKDKLRTKELIEKGFRVIRLWEHEIKEIELNDLRRLLQNET